MTNTEQKKVLKMIKRQAEILIQDLQRAPVRMTAAQRAENIAGMAKRLLEVKDE